jgi:hypothetical protein
MRRLGLVALAAALALVIAAATAPAANNSEQVVFSKTGAFSNTFGVMGLWIWCEADSGNPYVGACNGSVYFYFVTPKAFGVSGSIAESPADSGLYTITVSSRDGFISNCQFRNPNPAVKGQNNTLQLLACTVGGTTFSGPAETITTTANVNVTGP